MDKALAVICTPSTVMIQDVETTLDGLQFLVAGDLEGLAGNGQWVGYCNEEAHLLGLPPNPTGTMLAQLLGWRGHAIDGVIRGTIVFLGTDDEGNDRDVPLIVMEALPVLFNMAGRAV